MATRGGFAAALLLCALLLGRIGGCRDRSDDAGDNPTEPHSDPAEFAPRGSTYLLRGIVVDLPEPGRPSSDFVLRHEAIPTWARSDGSFGMPAMQMAFFSETPTDFSGVKVGDKVEITWISWWEESKFGPKTRSFIQDVRVLDPATELDLPSG